MSKNNFYKNSTEKDYFQRLWYLLLDLDQEKIKGNFYKEKNVYESFLETFKATVNIHVSLKEKVVRGNVYDERGCYLLFCYEPNVFWRFQGL